MEDDLFKHKDMPRIHRKNSYASCLHDGDKIFIHFGNLGTACLTVDGVLVWKKTFNYSPVHGGGSSPVVLKSFNLQCRWGGKSFVVCSKQENGSIAWKSRSSDAKKNFLLYAIDHSANGCKSLALQVSGVFRMICEVEKFGSPSTQVDIRWFPDLFSLRGLSMLVVVTIIQRFMP